MENVIFLQIRFYFWLKFSVLRQESVHTFLSQSIIDSFCHNNLYRFKGPSLLMVPILKSFMNHINIHSYWSDVVFKITLTSQTHFRKLFLHILLDLTPFDTPIHTKIVKLLIRKYLYALHTCLIFIIFNQEYTLSNVLIFMVFTNIPSGSIKTVRTTLLFF